MVEEKIIMSKAYFEFVFGAMGCGKTSELRGNYYSKVGELFEVVIVKPSKDKKGEEYIVARDGSKLKVDFLLNDSDNIYDLISSYLFDNNLDYILVDEIQFLNEEQIIQLSRIVDKLGINVVGYGIITDFCGHMFEGAIHVMEWADKFSYLDSQCSCGNLKIRNMRLYNGEAVFEGEQVAIDGVDFNYKSVCRECYLKEKNKVKKKIIYKNKSK